MASHSEEGGLIFGGTAGLLASIPIGDGPFMIEPALVFSMKGGGWGAGEGGEDKHYDYVEVPVLLRYGAKVATLSALASHLPCLCTNGGFRTAALLLRAPSRSI